MANDFFLRNGVELDGTSRACEHAPLGIRRVRNAGDVLTASLVFELMGALVRGIDEGFAPRVEAFPPVHPSAIPI